MASPDEVALRMARSLFLGDGSLEQRLINAARRFDNQAFTHHNAASTRSEVLDELRFIGDLLNGGEPVGGEGRFAAAVSNLEEYEREDLAFRILVAGIRAGFIPERHDPEGD